MALENNSCQRVGKTWVRDYATEKWEIAMQSMCEFEYGLISRVPIDIHNFEWDVEEDPASYDHEVAMLHA